ncbi:MAG: hypothetical protein ACFFAO_15675 [Candidatus Hermodarchaeota archaeon]
MKEPNWDTLEDEMIDLWKKLRKEHSDYNDTWRAFFKECASIWGLEEPSEEFLNKYYPKRKLDPKALRFIKHWSMSSPEGVRENAIEYLEQSGYSNAEVVEILDKTYKWQIEVCIGAEKYILELARASGKVYKFERQ